MKTTKWNKCDGTLPSKNIKFIEFYYLDSYFEENVSKWRLGMFEVDKKCGWENDKKLFSRKYSYWRKFIPPDLSIPDTDPTNIRYWE